MPFSIEYSAANRCTIHSIQHLFSSSYQDQITIAFYGVITNFQSLVKTTDCSIDSNSELLSHLYSQFGTEAFGKIKGEYCFVLIDKSKDLIYASRDHVGTTPLYYYADTNRIIFSPDGNQILQRHHVPYLLNNKWPLYYLLNMPDENWGTIHRNIFKIPNGHYLKYENKKISLIRFWNPVYNNIRNHENKEIYINRFRELLQISIENRMLKNQDNGAELSGGLDSSLITSILSDISFKTGVSLSVFSEMYPEKLSHKFDTFYHERQDSDLIANSLGIKNRYLITNDAKTLLQLLELANKVHFEPPFMMVSIFASGIYELAKELGINNLFSGFGGDEFVSSHSVVDYYTLIKNHKFEDIFHLLSQSIRNPKFLYRSLAKQFVHQTGIQPISSKVKRVLKKIDKIHVIPEVDKRFNLTYNRKNLITKNTGLTYLERLEEKLFGIKYLPNRLHGAFAMTNHYGINHRYPLLDVDLIEFYFSVPFLLRGDALTNRKLFRNAAKGLIPDKIVKKRGVKSSTNPSGIYLTDRDQGIVFEALKDYYHTPNHLIHEYIDLKKLIDNEEKKLVSNNLYHSKAIRLYLITRKLDEY